jgi:hypothetical protein
MQRFMRIPKIGNNIRFGSRSSGLSTISRGLSTTSNNEDLISATGTLKTQLKTDALTMTSNTVRMADGIARIARIFMR